MDPPGFLNVRRQVFRVEFPDGSLSDPFTYDSVDRERLDAVVIAPHYRGADGRRHVYLRSALRPPAATRSPAVCPVPEKPTLGALWELPAGLVEVDERSAEGLQRSAVRELLEEVGFDVDPSALRALGPPSFPAPGMVGERHFYFHVEVDPARQGQPTEDGSPLERLAAIAVVPLDEAIELTRRGEIEDAKTEVALRRLAEL
ncbi:NUDIX hydrolase [Sorangium sp. So ce131]|uniref:NUDIX hydrolase n=1 Tax=Sorangium sp. So ce131 TaxID=3133282 RepID=UPI003F5DD112